jgi:hypothetical protein
VVIIATFLLSRRRKGFFENESQDRLQKGFLGEWDLFRNIPSEQFLMGPLEKRSRLNEKGCNSRPGSDQMTNEICFEKRFASSFDPAIGDATTFQQEYGQMRVQIRFNDE